MTNVIRLLLLGQKLWNGSTNLPSNWRLILLIGGKNTLKPSLFKGKESYQGI